MPASFTQYCIIPHNLRDGLDVLDMPGGNEMPSVSRMGGYDEGYEACPCFWGEQPGSMVKLLTSHVGVEGLRVLDAGCGEGKNSAHLAARGAHVTAIDISPHALANAQAHWRSRQNVTWRQADIAQLEFGRPNFHIVIAYGLLHCMPDRDAVLQTIKKLQEATKPAGYNIVVAFNDRYQDLRAHPGFLPCLLAHSDYVQAYSSWELLHASDTNLAEVHPHNCIPHVHALTRILARRGE